MVTLQKNYGTPILFSHQKWIDDWVFLANRYKDKDAVVAMDINNEPHGKFGGGSRWGSGDITNDWRLAAQECGNAILAVNPNVLIMVEGIEEFEGETYWWGGNLKGVTDYPVILSNPAKLMYSPHEYGPTVFNQSWFSAPNFPNNMPAIWEANFNYLITQNISPLFAGEFGLKFQGGTDEVWFDAYLEFMGQKGYSWAYWSWNPNSGDTGGILTDDWSTIHNWKMNKLIPHLAPEIPNNSGVNCDTSYTINASANNGGTISPNGLINISQGADQTFIITAANNFEIDDVMVNGSSVGAVSSYTFTNVQANQTITASFRAIGIPTFEITAFAGNGGTISPNGLLNVSQGADQTFIITAANGFEINDVVVNGSSVGAVSSYTFTNVQANQSISVLFSQVSSGDCSFGTPISSALASGQFSASHAHVLGNGGPDLSNVNAFTINWDLGNNGLWQFSFNTTNGNPNWYIDLRNYLSQSFNQPQPDLSISGSGITGFDGDYWVNWDNGNFVMVSKTGTYTIYFSNDATPPTCNDVAIARTKAVTNTQSIDQQVIVYPNPFQQTITVKINDLSDIESLTLFNISGQLVKHITIPENKHAIELGLGTDISSGIYFLKIVGSDWAKQVKLIKE